MAKSKKTSLSKPSSINKKTRSESRARYFIREKAQKRGWNIAHPDTGGNFLEENEIVKYLPDIGLGVQRPDFLILLAGIPVAVIEAKNESTRLNIAIKEACEYADEINKVGRYSVKIAVGAAGEEDTGFEVAVYYLVKDKWKPLGSKGTSLTAIPSIKEIELALKANNATTAVSVPEQSEFIDAAIEMSLILRQAKVEAPLRPKVIGAIVAAMYEGIIDISPTKALASVNTLMSNAINGTDDLRPLKKKQLIDALKLSGADFNRLAEHIGRIVTIMNRLNVRAVLQTDTDFLGMFYEAFLRYGYDNKALGIVFTPRHITRFCVELTEVGPNDKIIDIATGTGGFLVAAFDSMNNKAKSNAQREQIKHSLAGFDTNPTIWALASLNMFFRGDGKSHIELGSCFEKKNKASVKGKFTRAYLNPPFSQKGEPEKMFIDTAMDALEPGKPLAAVVYAGIFADNEHKEWRKQFLRKHSLLGMISLPDDLFYPTAAPTSIIIAEAHVPHDEKSVFMARVWNDGFEKLKGKRVTIAGEQLTEVKEAFLKFKKGQTFKSSLVTVTNGKKLANGSEWSPQQWLPQPVSSKDLIDIAQSEVMKGMFRAVAHLPELADSALEAFPDCWKSLPPLPTGITKPLTYFFHIKNGKSSGEKNFSDGDLPYVSSGDENNSIIRLVAGMSSELYADGAITITAFGCACLQPWPFIARGNGGSSVRVLIPKFDMGFKELIWFASQINLQRWRFFYARMAIKGRLEDEHFMVTSPAMRLNDGIETLATKLANFKKDFEKQSQL